MVWNKTGNDEIFVTIEGKLRETDKAILFQIAGEEVWIPKSVCEEFNDDTITLPRWFAEKEGII